MLAVDVMEEMAWDDFISKVAMNAYRLNTKGQVQTALITWLSCSDHVTAQALMKWLFGH